MKTTKQQSGFTLIEIAIVLVIIGLLLGGVLKGQEIIENSRIKSVVTDMRGVSAAFTGYLDRYHALPGDELPATATARGWGAVGGGDANGVLNLPLTDTFTNASAEHVAMWRVLRASGFLTGSQALVGVAALPRSATGGLVGAAVSPYGLLGASVCTSGLSHKQAAGIDIIVDGALSATNVGANTGDIRGNLGTANPLAPVVAPSGAAYNETLATTWTLCRRLQ